MKAKDANHLFRESKRLFAEGRCADALAALEALDAAFPHQKNILYPKALCMARLGREDEALALCERLVVEFADARAYQLRTELQSRRAPKPEMPLFQPIQLDIAPPPVYKPAAPEKTGWKEILLYIGVAAGTLVVAILAIGLVAYLAAQQPDAPVDTGTQTAETAPDDPLDYGERMQEVTPLQAFVLLAMIFTNGFPLYVSLFMVGKLPYGDFWKDLLHTWFIGTLVGVVARVCCCITVPLAIVFVKRSYDLEFGEVLIWIFAEIVLGIVQYLVLRSVGFGF